jgi:hypothetical protein
MVRTRFAPSPTGYLHIGGVRTALFNWLYARQQGGQFLLRIDDTDQQRNVEAALHPILEGFRWLGLDWDEGPQVDGPYAPYYQSQRGHRYRQAVQQLLAAGAAYRDYARLEEFQAERETAQQQQEIREELLRRRAGDKDIAVADTALIDHIVEIEGVCAPQDGPDDLPRRAGDSTMHHRDAVAKGELLRILAIEPVLGLRVVLKELEPAAEQPALGVDLVDGELEAPHLVGAVRL